MKKNLFTLNMRDKKKSLKDLFLITIKDLVLTYLKCNQIRLKFQEEIDDNAFFIITRHTIIIIDDKFLDALLGAFSYLSSPKRDAYIIA
uniref:CSON014337 protein n=1 Tax=Culicoides sonorensis TaxID=179676 RepID=A0A336MEN2_CULSO